MVKCNFNSTRGGHTMHGGDGTHILARVNFSHLKFNLCMPKWY
jgi:hypothetical protein